MSENPTTQPEQPKPPTPEQRLADINVQVQQFKNDWETIKTAKVEVDGIKTALSEARGAVNADITAISETKTNFQNLKKQTQDHLNQLNTKAENLNTQIGEVEALKNKLNTALGEIQKTKTEAEQAKNSVTTDVEAINQTKTNFENLRGETQNIHNDLKSRQTDAQNKITEIHDLHGKLKELHSELLEDERDESNNITEESVNTQIQNLFGEMQKLATEMKKQRDDAKTELAELKEALETEIRSLLPKAGAAGLSSAYVQAKSKYGSIPYEGKLMSWGYVGHVIKSHAPTVIYYTLFIAPLIAMIWLFVDLFKDLQSNGIDEKVMIFRALIAVPLGVISLFGWSSIRLGRRLYEEYNHKQRVMQLYHSFKEEIEGHGNDDHKKALLSIMLKAVDDKPLLAMHKYDKGIEDLWPSLGLANLLPFLTGRKNSD
ncbi:MAG: hypothetical protein CO093_02165 [Alphaproteobacteria bacterium CG_4_9_14_3_um_filter_47_13]|nr:MAG: hypothetical protein CO093_02165 [Alphaproteobacteria bacterium CG_4_9_14_3_um_filter_47_13]